MQDACVNGLVHVPFFLAISEFFLSVRKVGARLFFFSFYCIYLLLARI